MRIVLPAYWVASEYGVPQVCSRHGEPAVQRVGMNIPSRPPGWAYALLAIGPLPFVAAVYATRRTVRTPSWPFCARCEALRIRLLVIAALGVVGGIALCCAGLSLAHEESYTAKSLLLVFFLLGPSLSVSGLAVATRSARTTLARVRASDDATKVDISKAHQRFAAQLATLLTQAGAQHRYGQQAHAGPTHQPHEHPAAPQPPR